MTDKDHTPRRRVLKVVSAGAAATFIGSIESQPAVATSESEESNAVASGALPDLRVKNKSRNVRTLSVEITEVEKNRHGDFQEVGQPVYKRSFSLMGLTRSDEKASSVAARPLPLRGNTVYKVESTTDKDDETVDDLIGIPEGGVPDHMSIVVNLRHPEKLEVTTSKD